MPFLPEFCYTGDFSYLLLLSFLQKLYYFPIVLDMRSLIFNMLPTMTGNSLIRHLFQVHKKDKKKIYSMLNVLLKSCMYYLFLLSSLFFYIKTFGGDPQVSRYHPLIKFNHHDISMVNEKEDLNKLTFNQQTIAFLLKRVLLRFASPRSFLVYSYWPLK